MQMFHCRKCNLNQKWNNDKCLCECDNKKKVLCAKNNGILQHVVVIMVNMQKVLLTIQQFICDEIIEDTKTILTRSTSTNFYIILAFLIVTISC